MKKVLTIAMAALMSMAAMAQNDSKFSTDRLQKLTSRAEMQKHRPAVGLGIRRDS